jgi:hypothetical protein
MEYFNREIIEVSNSGPKYSSNVLTDPQWTQSQPLPIPIAFTAENDRWVKAALESAFGRPPIALSMVLLGSNS